MLTFQAIVGPDHHTVASNPGHHTVISNQVSWAERSQSSYHTLYPELNALFRVKNSLSWAERSPSSQELSIPSWTLSSKSRTLYPELNALNRVKNSLFQAERSLPFYNLPSWGMLSTPIFQPTFQLQAFNYYDLPKSTTDPGRAIYQSMVLFFFLKSVTFLFCLVSSSQSNWGRECHVYHVSIWNFLPSVELRCFYMQS
jgi:hypothetical protein